MSIDVTQTMEYRIGYERGYKDGINEMMKTYQKQMDRVMSGSPNQIVIQVDPEKFEKIKDDFNVSTKNK